MFFFAEDSLPLAQKSIFMVVIMIVISQEWLLLRLKSTVPFSNLDVGQRHNESHFYSVLLCPFPHNINLGNYRPQQHHTLVLPPKLLFRSGYIMWWE